MALTKKAKTPSRDAASLLRYGQSVLDYMALTKKAKAPSRDAASQRRERLAREVDNAAERRVLLKLKEWLRKPGSGDYTRRDLDNALSLVEEFSTLTREDAHAATTSSASRRHRTMPAFRLPADVSAGPILGQDEPIETVLMEKFGLEAHHWANDGWCAERYDTENNTLSETGFYPTLDALKAALTESRTNWVIIA